MDSEEIRSYIQNFSFDNCRYGNQGYNRLLVQLFGFMGHGKTCFINSCKYVVDDAVAIAEYTKTMKRDPYRLTDTITLVDNRGCAKMDKSEAGEIYLQLGNFRPLGQEVIWDPGFNNMLRQLLDADREDRSADFIVPVFVHSAQHCITPHEYNDIKEILTKARDITGIFPAVVITYGSSKNLPEIQATFRNMGVQLIFPLENYTPENHLKIQKKHETILKCLRKIIKDVESRMEERRNRRAEMTERKKIIHTLIIEREIERVREETERERDRREAQRASERERDKLCNFS